ncbi:MAG: putative bifunctional diguanylate cyclase/phosphodiesterase [Janthinobacterium lividum]
MGEADRHQTPVLAALVHETLVVANYSSVTHVAIALSMAVFFWQSAPKPYLIFLAAAMTVTNAVTLTLAIRSRDAIPQSSPRNIERGRRLAIGLAFTIGAIWSTMPYALFRGADVGHQFIVIATAAGLVSDAFVVGPLLAVSMALVVPIVAGSALALCVLQPPSYGWISILLAIYAAFVFASQLRLAQYARERIRDRLLVAEQGQTIALLLNDFEEGASDWLWETDSEGRLRHAPARMAAALGCHSEDIQGEVFTEVLARHARPDTDDGVIGEVATAIAERRALQAATVALRVHGTDLWWLLNGKPCFSQDGDFQGYRGVGSDVSRDREAELRVGFFTTHDVLTGLSNRAAFQDVLRAICDGPEVQSGALLCIDLDGFKAVNDRHGHGVGDMLLVSVASLLRELAPAAATVSRLGGDEFAILLGGEDRGEAEALAAALVARIGVPLRIEGELLSIGASIGIAVTPDDATNEAKLLARADLALYSAKQGGKGRWERYDVKLDERLARRRRLDQDMRQALNDGDFELHYQPQIRLSDESVKGFEALLRWHHASEGWISPGEIIPIAEATGFIVDIGRWALRKACVDALSWQGRRVAVNISPSHFRLPDFVDSVFDVLDATGLPADLLEIEITESILLDREHDVLGNLTRLRDRGVRIALDDFGTGYSSLSYLTSFSFDTIKIDQSFVRHLRERPEGAAVVEAVTLMARALSMEVTAEGVEDVHQLRLILSKRCDNVQGFLYGRAQPLHVLPSVILQLPRFRRELGSEGSADSCVEDAAV